MSRGRNPGAPETDVRRRYLHVGDLVRAHECGQGKARLRRRVSSGLPGMAPGLFGRTSIGFGVALVWPRYCSWFDLVSASMGHCLGCFDILAAFVLWLPRQRPTGCRLVRPRLRLGYLGLPNCPRPVTIWFGVGVASMWPWFGCDMSLLLALVWPHLPRIVTALFF